MVFTIVLLASAALLTTAVALIASLLVRAPGSPLFGVTFRRFGLVIGGLILLLSALWYLLREDPTDGPWDRFLVPVTLEQGCQHRCRFTATRSERYVVWLCVSRGAGGDPGHALADLHTRSTSEVEESLRLAGIAWEVNPAIDGGALETCRAIDYWNEENCQGDPVFLGDFDAQAGLAYVLDFASEQTLPSLATGGAYVTIAVDHLAWKGAFLYAYTTSLVTWLLAVAGIVPALIGLLLEIRSRRSRISPISCG